MEPRSAGPAHADLDVESLLAPLSVASPCGADLEYDPAFRALEEAGAGKPERQYGDHLFPSEPPDWPAVHAQAVELAGRTRDLRVAVWLVRSGARTGGLKTGLQGLQLVNGLIERHWDHVHPALDAADGNDPTARLSALAPLVHAGAAMADLRAASLTGRKGSLTVRDLELALGSADPVGAETVVGEADAVGAVAAAIEQAPELGLLMQAGAETMHRLTAAIDRHVDSSQGVDFKPIDRLLQMLARAALAPRSGGEPAEHDTAAAADGPNVNRARAATGVLAAIGSRQDAVTALDRVCDWLEHNEPSNPAPLLIRRGQRLISKSFIEIIRDLVPEGLEHVEKLAGTTSA